MATTILLSVNCLLILGIYLLLGYILWVLIREFSRKERQPSPLASLREGLETFFGDGEERMPVRARIEKRWEHLKKPALGLPSPLCKWTGEHTSASMDFDQQYEIKSHRGLVLGSCGVRLAPLEGYNTNTYDRVYEVYLQDKAGGERESKYIVSYSLRDDEALKERLGGREKMVEDPGGLRIETERLYMRVVSETIYFEQPFETIEGETIEWSKEFRFTIWRKGLMAAGNVSEEVPKEGEEIPTPSQLETPSWELPKFARVLDEIPRAPRRKKDLRMRLRMLEETLEAFGAPGRVEDIETGPYATTFLVIPMYTQTRWGKRLAGLRQFEATCDDLALALAVPCVNIREDREKKRIRIEVPNENHAATFHQILLSRAYRESGHPLKFPLGHGNYDQPAVASLDELYSILLAGAPGTGVDAFLDTLICALLLQHSPAELNLALVGSERKSFQEFASLPHLFAPIAGEETIYALIEEVFEEFGRREEALQEAEATSFRLLNALREAGGEPRLPNLVLAVSELGDIIQEYSGFADDRVIRMAEVGARSGVHVIVATGQTSQASTEVLLPRVETKVAFALRDIHESWEFYQFHGAERLTDPYEYLIKLSGLLDHVRYRLAPVSEGEKARIVAHWKAQALS